MPRVSPCKVVLLLVVVMGGGFSGCFHGEGGC